MQAQQIHSFHIPVMGLAFTIDSPLKIARYGISSVVSLGDDVLIEDMRAYYSSVNGMAYMPIKKDDFDARAKRITAYLNLLDLIVNKQFEKLRNSSFTEKDSEIIKYLGLLPDNSPLNKLYKKWSETNNLAEKAVLEQEIRQNILPGAIDVNIMTKLDKINTAKDGIPLPNEFSDALAGMRGFAMSNLSSSVVLSAGFNPRLYAYIEEFADFFPDENGDLKKKIILKVSDFRSAQIQGKFLAKKGILISEFRIESGLNCGGHAFATEGYLLGPIMEEFRQKREQLREEMWTLCVNAWQQKQINIPAEKAYKLRVTVQGGIGTSNEHNFLLDHYGADATGWGTPFLLVPEATTVDAETLVKLIKAGPDDLYLSEASPLGVPFNNLRDSASEQQQKKRIDMERPGSPCLKKFLVSNTEFTDEPICTASRQYQYNKLIEIDKLEIEEVQKNNLKTSVLAKACLCEDLSAPAYINAGVKPKLKPATAICPGPNLAFFSGKFSLKEMTDHIYGRLNLLNNTYRPNVFMNELKMYIEYLQKEIEKAVKPVPAKQIKYFTSFKSNLIDGINYYKNLIPEMINESTAYKKLMQNDLSKLENSLKEVIALINSFNNNKNEEQVLELM